MAIQIEVTYRPGQPPETVQHTVPDPLPAELSKTAFMDHAIAQFIAVNGGDIGDGYERFDEVMEAARTSAQGKVRAAYKRYDAADRYPNRVDGWQFGRWKTNGCRAHRCSQ